MHLILLLLAFICPGAPVCAPVLELHLGGQVIRMAVPGQELVALGDQPITLNKVVDSQGYETVYNLRVSNHHTYFVGCADWGFSVWAHNQCDVEILLEYCQLSKIRPAAFNVRFSISGRNFTKRFVNESQGKLDPAFKADVLGAM